MSTDTPAEPILLSQDQADRILTYAIEHRMYETGPEGLGAVDPQTRLNDAATLAFQAKRAAAAGNDSESVKEVLFIAQVDMTPTQPAEAAATAAPPAPAAEVDPYAETTDEQLEEALQAFRAVPASETIQAEIDRVEAVLAQRRQGAQATPAAQPAQEDTPSAAPPAPAGAPGPVAGDAAGQQPAAATPPAPAAAAPAPPVPAGGPEPHTPPPPQDLPPVPGHQRSGVISAGGAPDASGATAPPPGGDAAAVAGAQAPQPGSEGGVPAAEASAQSGDPALLAQLTWATMEAYGLTIQEAKELDNDQLRMILANPGGPVDPGVPAPQTAASTVAPEREALEAQVTGSMIKAWGRGRKQIPDLSDADLSTMIQYPGGPSTVPADASVQSPPQSAEESASPQASAAAASPPAAEPPPAAPPATAPAATTPARSPSDPAQVSDAMEIIEREHFPIPPDIEDPYKLPNDVSKESDVELRSLHARAHAVEARVNWVISDRDDEVGDLERLLADRRRVVKLETPTTVDSKRLTKDQIEARIEGDAEVIDLKGQIAVIQKGTGKLKVIRDNAHRDCERLSRQWSMRYKEENFSPAR